VNLLPWSLRNLDGGNQVGVIVLPRVKEEKTYLILTKFTKVKYFLICVKVPKRHTLWDGESIKCFQNNKQKIL